ncbi:putative ribonuclease H-like domain-containing protein [Tanacetum coccineum]
MDLETAQTTTTTKFPIIKHVEYDMWRLRIEQYFQEQDYALCDVIENGNSFKLVAQTTTNADGTLTSLIPGPVTTEEKAQKKNDVKARSKLLMTLPNEHLMTFNQYKDAKTLFAAIQTRFGDNDATKKTQKTLLKQMYENFSAPSTESLDSIFNRLQKIVSQLAILGENISQEDLNLKFLRSLPSEWNTHVVVWRNKPDLDTMSFDDLYNNFKIVEQEVKGTASSSSSSQNMAFVSSPSSTNEVNTAYGVSTANTQVSPASTQVSTASTQVSTANLSDDTVYAFLASQPNGSQLVYEDLEQIHEDDIEEMDLKWQLALLSMRTRRIELNKSEFNLDTYKRGLASVEEQLVFYKKNEFEKLKQEKENNQLKIENFDNASKSLDKLIGSQITDKSIKGVGFVSYNVVPPLHTGLFLPPNLDLSYSGLEEFQQPEFEGYGPQISKSVSEDISNEVRESSDVLLVEELVSYDKLKKKTNFPTVAKIDFVKAKQQEKPVRKPIKLTAITIKGKRLTQATEHGSIHKKEDQGLFMDRVMPRPTNREYVLSSDFKEFNGRCLHLGRSQMRKILVKELFKNSLLRGSSQDYILMPLWKDGSLFDSSLKNASNDEPQPSRDTGKKDYEGVNKESRFDDQERPENKVDMSNITTTYPVPSTLNTRIHKDHLLDHVIEEPKKVIQALKDLSWIEAMQEEILQFKLQQVWTLVDLPHGKRAIGTKWVYRNKKDERGELIKAIRLFLACASFKDFVVYQMDVKSASLYGKIEEEVYVCQPLGFEDPEFPDRVYKVEKTLYGLHQAPRACFEKIDAQEVPDEFFGELTFFLGLQVTQKDDGIFISQDMYVDEILKKFGFLTVKTTSTPMETSKPLMKDENAEDVDVHLYRSTIVSLMYLTSSRPDIMFAVCTCVRFHVIPKVSHLHVVKRIFRYLKGQPKLGLWYHKDSPFDLEAYTDSDYASASLDRKSTTGGCQFLGSRLILWQCKKQTIVANSTTEGHPQKKDQGYVNSRCSRHMTGNMSYLSGFKEFDGGYVTFGGEAKGGKITEKLEESNRFEGIIDFLNASSIRYVLMIQALVDGKKVIVTETSMRRALQLKDVEGTECLPNATIFAELERMWYENLTQKLTFYKAFFSPQWKFLIHTILQCLSAKTTTWNEFSSTMASAVICLATNKKFNFSKYIFDNMVKNLEGGVKFLMYPRFVQVFLDKQVKGMTKHKEIYVTPSHTKKVFANMKRGGKGFSGRPQKKQPRRKQREDTEVPQPSGSTKPITNEAANEEHVPTHSNDPLFSGEDRLTARIESFKDEGLGAQEDTSKQGRKIADLDADAEEVEVEKVVSTAEVTTVSATTTTVDELTLAQTLIEMKAGKPKAVTTAVTRPKARGVVVQEPSEFRTTTSFSQLPHAKDKGKAKMIEPEKPLKKKDQILIDEEIAQKLQAQLNAELEEEEKLAKQREEDANMTKWDNFQAMINTDYELAARLQAQEQEELTVEENSKLFVELMDKRKMHFARLRAEEQRRKPPTKA